MDELLDHEKTKPDMFWERHPHCFGAEYDRDVNGNTDDIRRPPDPTYDPNANFEEFHDWVTFNPYCMKAGKWYDIMKACYENPIPITPRMKQVLGNAVGKFGMVHEQTSSNNGYPSPTRGVPAAFFHPRHYCEAWQVMGEMTCTAIVVEGYDSCACIGTTDDERDDYEKTIGYTRFYTEASRTNTDITGCDNDENCKGGYWTGKSPETSFLCCNRGGMSLSRTFLGRSQRYLLREAK
jgi:hypothetical protein